MTTRNPFDNLSIEALHRIYRRLQRRLGHGRHFGWDYPTVRLAHPGIHSSMKRVVAEIARRWEATGE